MLLRHLLSVVLLPGMVTVGVPIWIARSYGLAVVAPSTMGDVALVALGVLALVVGLVLFAASLGRFVSEGRGTLAPWDPPRTLVIRGPYRYVRNPMISGVIFITIGEALILRSQPHAWWALTFVVLNLIVIPAVEEPMLVERFGDDYREYRRRVPRFIPLVRPYDPGK